MYRLSDCEPIESPKVANGQWWVFIASTCLETGRKWPKDWFKLLSNDQHDIPAISTARKHPRQQAFTTLNKGNERNAGFGIKISRLQTKYPHSLHNVILGSTQYLWNRGERYKQVRKEALKHTSASSSMSMFKHPKLRGVEGKPLATRFLKHSKEPLSLFLCRVPPLGPLRFLALWMPQLASTRPTRHQVMSYDVTLIHYRALAWVQSQSHTFRVLGAKLGDIPYRVS